MITISPKHNLRHDLHRGAFCIITTALALSLITMFRPIHAESEYNYLALGDSLTVHGVNDYWWQECGMAASVPEKDYVHQVTSYLRQSHDTVNTDVYNGNWGISSQLMSDYYTELKKYLSKKKYDLITIQYGIDLRSSDGLEDEFGQLISTCRQYSPNARIIIVGNFLGSSENLQMIDAIKVAAAKKYECGFANLTEAKDNAYYQRGLGSTVYDNEGNPHTVENKGVAVHPNDEGMALIAQKIEEQINPDAEIDANVTKATPALDHTNLDLPLGKSAKLSIMNPKGTILWKASDDRVFLSSAEGASVRVTANRTGTSKITVRLNGVKAVCNVFVQKKPVADGWHTIGGKKYYYRNGAPLSGVSFISGRLCVFSKDGVFSQKRTKKLESLLRSPKSLKSIKDTLVSNGAVYQGTSEKKKATLRFEGFSVTLVNDGQGKKTKKTKKTKKSKASQKLKKQNPVRVKMIRYRDGFQKFGKKQFYYENGRKLTGVHVIRHTFYYFGKDGAYQKNISKALQKASKLNADAGRLKALLKQYGAVYKYTEDMGFSCFGDGTDQILYYTNFQVSVLKGTNGKTTVENIAKTA